jgi:K+-transporting ATPase KdpF subunit
VRFVYAALTRPGVLSFDATRYLDGRPDFFPHVGQLCLRGGVEEASVMLGYILAGVVAALLTLYLFVAMLFPERF